MSPGFETFSVQHFTILFFFGMITWVAIRKGKAASEPLKTNIGLVMAGLTFSSLILEAIFLVFFDQYDVLQDLPLFLCDLVAIMLPFILWFKNRKWMGILYFWSLAGTLQALITPDIEYGFPSFHFFRYFFTHAGIVAAVLYTIVVWNIRIRWTDFTNAILYAQFYLVAIHLINQVLGSNYSYTVQKPQGGTVLDYFGDWPWYILGAEALMVFLFLLLMLPFLKKSSSQIKEGPVSTDFFESN